jgi:hypothetical protein
LYVRGQAVVGDGYAERGLWEYVSDAAGDLQLSRKNPLNDVPTRTRKQGNEGLPQGPKRVHRFLVRGLLGHNIGQRMPDKRRIDAALPEICLLERQNDGQAVHAAAKLANPPCPPRPKLWCDVVQHRHAGLSYNLGQAKVQGRGVHENRRGKAFCTEGLPTNSQHPPRFAYITKRSQEHCCLGSHVMDDLTTFGGHPRPADPDESNGWMQFPGRPNQ